MKKRTPRKEKKKIIKEGGIGHYRVMLTRCHNYVSTEHIPCDYFGWDVHWTVPTEIYLKEFRRRKNLGK